MYVPGRLLFSCSLPNCNRARTDSSSVSSLNHSSDMTTEYFTHVLISYHRWENGECDYTFTLVVSTVLELYIKLTISFPVSHKSSQRRRR